MQNYDLIEIIIQTLSTITITVKSILQHVYISASVLMPLWVTTTFPLIGRAFGLCAGKLLASTPSLAQINLLPSLNN